MAQSESEVVGREAELHALADFLDRSSALPGALLLEGEAGHRQDDALAARPRARLRTLVPCPLVQPFRVGDPALLRRARRPARGCPRGGSHPAARTSAARPRDCAAARGPAWAAAGSAGGRARLSRGAARSRPRQSRRPRGGRHPVARSLLRLCARVRPSPPARGACCRSLRFEEQPGASSARTRARSLRRGGSSASR